MNEIPNILEMQPKAARRAWLAFMGDHNIVSGSGLFPSGEFVRCAIDGLILNEGDGAEESARKRLEQDLTIFRQKWADWRG